MKRPEKTNSGSYKCPYCYRRSHRTFQNYATVEKHIQDQHYIEAHEADLIVQNARLLKENNQLKKAYEQKQEKYYSAIWACSSCCNLFQGGMPRGAAVNTVPCGNCGMKCLHLIVNVSSFFPKF